MGMDVTNVIFMPANTAPALQPLDPGVTETRKSSYLRNAFREARAAADSDSSDGAGQSEWKTFRKGFRTLDVIKTFVIQETRPKYRHWRELGRS